MQQLSWYWRSRLLLNEVTEESKGRINITSFLLGLCSVFLLMFGPASLFPPVLTDSSFLAWLVMMVFLSWWRSGGKEEEEEVGKEFSGLQEGNHMSLQADESDTPSEHILLTTATLCRCSIFRFLRTTGGWPAVRTVTTAAALLVGAVTLSLLCLVPDINTKRHATWCSTCAKTCIPSLTSLTHTQASG